MNSKVGERILALDGWRAFAILTVLVGHFSPVPGINMGLFGVELFFVLSGRLMADILFVKKLELGEFFYRRVTRIFPALAVFVLAFFVFGLVVGDPYRVSPLWVVSSLTFMQNYAIATSHFTGWLDHLWSLCVEEHSYILLGLLVYLLGRGPWRPLIAVLVVGLVAMANGVIGELVFKQGFFTNYVRSDVHIASIFISGAIYLLLRHRMDQVVVERAAPWLFAATLVGGVVFSLSAFPTSVNFTIGTTCLAVAVALIDIAPRVVVRLLSLPWLTQIGIWSYSMYLWQQPFYMQVEYHSGWMPLMLAGAIVASLVSFYFVERPARRMLNAMWGRWRLRKVGQAGPSAS